MKTVIIAGAAVVAVILGLFAAGLFRLLWLSVPYETWLEYEREKGQRTAQRTQKERLKHEVKESHVAL